jgi:hypothetical protein
MTIIANQQVYTFLSATDTFILATRGNYIETFKKDEIDVVLANKDELVPNILYEKSVFNATERDLYGTEYTNKRS